MFNGKMERERDLGDFLYPEIRSLARCRDIWFRGDSKLKPCEVIGVQKIQVSGICSKVVVNLNNFSCSLLHHINPHRSPWSWQRNPKTKYIYIFMTEGYIMMQLPPILTGSIYVLHRTSFGNLWSALEIIVKDKLSAYHIHFRPIRKLEIQPHVRFE